MGDQPTYYTLVVLSGQDKL